MAASTPQPLAPRTHSPAAAPRSNFIAAPAVPAATPGRLATPGPPLAPGLPDAKSVKPPASDIAALEKMLRRAPPPPTAHRSSSRIPGGSACLEMLDGLHLPYSRLDHVKGIKTPVSVRARIGGIRYRSWGKRPLVADCRFVVALEWIAPILKQIGVTEVRYIGTYSYRMARVGRLSLHAYGLAIDIAGMVADGRMHKVSKAFTRGMGQAGCSPAAPVLDQVACRVKAMGLFREVLTPDSNADHANHFHFGVLPIGMTLASLPRRIPGHHRHHHVTKKHTTKLADKTAPKNDDAPHADAKLAKTDETDTRHHHPDKTAKHAARHHHSAKHAGRSAKAHKHTHHHSAKHAARSAKTHSTHRHHHTTKPASHVAKRAKHPAKRHSAKHVHPKAHSSASRNKGKVARHHKAHKSSSHHHAHRTAERHSHHGRARKSDQHKKH